MSASPACLRDPGRQDSGAWFCSHPLHRRSFLLRQPVQRVDQPVDLTLQLAGVRVGVGSLGLQDALHQPDKEALLIRAEPGDGDAFRLIDLAEFSERPLVQNNLIPWSDQYFADNPQLALVFVSSNSEKYGLGQVDDDKVGIGHGRVWVGAGESDLGLHGC